MAERREYRRKRQAVVTAVRLDLDTEGFTYRKWGGLQRCKAGDWLVCRQGSTYTVDAEVFVRTYRQVGPGVYAKVTPVWAERAEQPGSIDTKEGATAYAAGDVLVFNDPDGRDGYAMKAETFDELYEPAEPDSPE
jgi:hypothetical protein